MAAGAAQAQTPNAYVEFDVAAKTPEPEQVAVETIPSGSGNTTQVGAAAYRNIVVSRNNGTRANRELDLFSIGAQSKTALESDEGWFVRFALNGAAFRGLVANDLGQEPADRSSTADLNHTLVHGGSGATQAVYRLDQDLALNRWVVLYVGLDDENRLAVADANPGMVTATMTLHSDQFDAVEGRNAVSTRFFGGTTPIIHKIKGLDVQVKMGTPAVADVGTKPVGFLWFVNQAGNRHDGMNVAATGAANASNVRLGCATARAKQLTGTWRQVRNASDGTALTDAHLIGTNGVGVKVAGDLSIGAFDLVKETTGGTPAMKMVNCPDKRGSARSPLKGNIKGTTTKPNEAMLSGRTAGVHHLCLEVDNAGAGTNSKPLAAQEFTATVSVTQTTPGLGIATKEGVIGRIVRNGASVNLAYLTVSEKYNQRLVITNRGPTSATYNLGGFATDTGAAVGLSDAAMQAREAGRNTVPAMGQVVLRVADLLKFTGGAGARASATLSLNASPANIQVATTQVNLQDGSTDTVLYTPEREAAPAAAASGC